MKIENRNHKDTVFRMLFNTPDRLLELYNAINETHYNNPDDLTITTLEGNTYLNMKNDVSFIIDFELNLYEHQSSICPNIPLRDLYYLSANLIKLIPLKKTYKSTAVKIPTPRFFVFYNGAIEMEDSKEYKLSDLFEKETDNPAIELVVTVLNVNEGRNSKLMEACKTLKGYSIFVNKVRQYISEAKDILVNINDTDISLEIDKEVQQKNMIADAVSKAVDYCIDNDILRDFFEQHRQEVIDMGILGYTAEDHMEVIREEGFEQGYDKGFDEAKKEDELIITTQSATISNQKETITSQNATITNLESEITRLKAELAAKAKQ